MWKRSEWLLSGTAYAADWKPSAGKGQSLGVFCFRSWLYTLKISLFTLVFNMISKWSNPLTQDKLLSGKTKYPSPEHWSYFLAGHECESIWRRQGCVWRCGPRREHDAGKRVHSDEGVGSTKSQQSALYPRPQPEVSDRSHPAQISR